MGSQDGLNRVQNSSDRRESGCRRGGFHNDLQQVVGTKADFAAGQMDDTRVAGTEHPHYRAAANTELLQPVDMIGIAEDLADASGAPRRQLIQKDRGFVQGWFAESGVASGLD